MVTANPPVDTWPLVKNLLAIEASQKKKNSGLLLLFLSGGGGVSVGSLLPRLIIDK